jgi:hypothetical protein
MSSKLKTLRQRNLIFFGLLVVLLGVYFLRPDLTTSAREGNLAFAFPAFDKALANRIELSKLTSTGEPGARVVLQRGSGSTWSLESHFRYPLKTGAEALLDSIAAARIKSDVTSRQETFATYAPSEGWTEVDVIDAQGKSMLRFGIGRYTYPDAFLRLGEGDQQRIVRAVNLSPSAARVESSFWIDTNLWPGLSVTSMIRIDVDQRREKRVLSLVKRGESPADVETTSPEKDPEGKKVWWLAGPEEGDAVTMDVQDLGREFTGMLIDDVVAGAATGEQEKAFGFDDPELVATLWSKQGEKVTKHVLEIGKRDESDASWYVRRKGAPWVFKVRGASAFQRMQQTPDEFLDKPEPEPDTDGAGDGAAPGAGPDGSPDGTPEGDAPKEPEAPKEPDAPKDPGAPAEPAKKDGDK